MDNTKSDSDCLEELEKKVQNLKSTITDLKDEVKNLKHRGDQWPG